MSALFSRNRLILPSHTYRSAAARCALLPAPTRISSIATYRSSQTQPTRLVMTATTAETEAKANHDGSAQQKKPNNKPASNKKEFHILMLHGYTQSGPLFRSKTRALEKLLAKALAPLSLTLVCHYPTAPLELKPSDIPGYVAPEGASASDGDDDSDAWAWFRRRDDPSAQGGIAYVGLDQGMAALASTIRAIGRPVDGVIGFSQGGAVAALVAAVLETPHRAVPEDGGCRAWAEDLRDANGGRGLRFAAVYSGFFATDESLAWCYEPRIGTPTVQFLGSLDTVVEESRSRALVERSESPAVVVHPGGHYVPISKEWAMALAGFVKQHALEKESEDAEQSSL